METYIAYFDETGDDGVTTASSTHFVLTSVYMPASKWQENYNKVKALRKTLRDKYGFHVSEEMHTKNFLTDKNPYRTYGWNKEVKQEILKAFTLTLAEMELQIINVVIDKNHFKDDSLSFSSRLFKYWPNRGCTCSCHINCSCIGGYLNCIFFRFDAGCAIDGTPVWLA